jgi:RimJ/RimL family protein N-acetyltransferase
MKPARLLYTPVASDTVQEFTRLLHDPHIRRYLLDGEIVSSNWCEERILESVRSFQQRGIGIWLVREAISSELVGFCGFLQIIPDHSEPQLVYALLERFTGCGYATEMARTAIKVAVEDAHFTTIYASVDACNVASVRVLQRIGFDKQLTVQGAFGPMFMLTLSTDTVTI